MILSPFLFFVVMDALSFTIDAAVDRIFLSGFLVSCENDNFSFLFEMTP